jgi:hypothetical protein
VRERAGARGSNDHSKLHAHPSAVRSLTRVLACMRVCVCVCVCAGKGIDKYCALRVQRYESRDSAAAPAIDPRLEAVVDRMFAQCLADGKERQALGIALEARRLDVVRAALLASADVPDALAYTLTVARTIIVHQGFRNEVRHQHICAHGDPALSHTHLYTHKMTAELAFDVAWGAGGRA